MKKIIRISAIFAAVAALASCNFNDYPEFTDDMSFVAFDASSVSVAENGKSVSIPLTIASLDPVKVSVAYAVKADDAATAVEGKNFKFRDDSGVLVFDGTERSGEIVVDVIDNPGVFTGDLSFTVEIVSAGSINLGNTKECKVTITDLDHPLAAILGSYSVSVDDYWNDHYNWTVNVVKDPSDVTVAWFEFLDPYWYKYKSYVDAGGNTFYGNVSDDMSTITIPQGQEVGYSYNDSEVVLKGFNDADADVASAYDDVHVTVSDGGKTLTITNAWGTSNASGFWTLFNGPVVLTKK